MSYDITAYRISHAKGWSIEPASPRREWLQQTPHKAANRCLPLIIANQAGWLIRCGMRFAVTWNGKNMPDALTFEFPDDPEQGPQEIVSIFGSGIITFRIPWLFRTTEGIGLFVRGATNFYKENVTPLDGLVETDWAPYTFTMNWKVIKPKKKIWFRPDDPICMIMPYPVGILEQFQTHTATIKDDEKLFQEFLEWRETRQKQVDAVAAGQDPEFKLDYVRGSKPDGTFADAHWSNLKLGKFEGAND